MVRSRVTNHRRIRLYLQKKSTAGCINSRKYIYEQAQTLTKANYSKSRPTRQNYGQSTKVKGKGPGLDTALLRSVRRATRSALLSQKWQMIGMS